MVTEHWNAFKMSVIIAPLIAVAYIVLSAKQTQSLHMQNNAIHTAQKTDHTKPNFEQDLLNILTNNINNTPKR